MKPLHQTTRVLLLGLVAMLAVSGPGPFASAAKPAPARKRVAISESHGALPRSSPEQQGIASADILAFIEAADKDVDTMNSFMLVRHGYVVAEGWWAPYDRETPHMLYSLSKSFTSTAVGLAIAEGKFSLDDTRC